MSASVTLQATDRPSLSARTRVVATALAVVTVVSTPSSAFTAFAGYALTLLAFLAAARVSWHAPAKRMALAAVFVVLMTCLTPFTAHRDAAPIADIAGWPIYAAGLWTMWNAAAKAVLSVGFLSLLVATTPPLQILQALDELHLPRLVVVLTGFIYRYLHVLRDEALRIRRACISRGYQARWLWQVRTIGGMIATLFLRSYERAERVHGAMCARGYEGHWPRQSPQKLSRLDIAFLFVAVLWLATMRVGLT